MSATSRGQFLLLLLMAVCGCGRAPLPAGVCCSISPAAGSGQQQVFHAVFASPKGIEQLKSVRVLINGDVDGRHACYVYYVRRENAFLLVNDSGEGTTRMTAGTAGALSNGQCRISAADSSARVSGNELDVALALSFDPRFVGQKRVYLASRSVSGVETPLQPGGSWVVSSGCGGEDWTPTLDSVSPANGGGSNQTFTLTYSALNANPGLADVRVLFNRTSEASSACYVKYDAAARTLDLGDDEARSFASMPLPGDQVVSNSQCSVSGAGSSVSVTHSQLTWKLSIAFKPSFAGRKNVYLYARGCNGRDTGTRRKGAWSVPYGSE